MLRDMARRLLCSLLVLSMFIITMTWVPEIPVSTQIDSGFETENNSSPKPIKENELTPLDEESLTRPNLYNLAYDMPMDGILNPVVVEQSGYAASPNISARTDSYQNLGYDLSLDVAHNWIADEAEVSVWNLQKLYAANGSYDQGYPGVNVNPNGTIDYYSLGWSADSTDTPTYADDVQLAAYDDTGRQYVMVESQGGKVGQNAFGHVSGTRIVWTQLVQNVPYTEDFTLNFDYFYLRGPLDKNPGEPIIGNCSITVSIDGTTIWNMSLLTLSQRGIWSDVGVIPITVPSAPSFFVFEIGLVIDESLTLDKRLDYDNNGIADGIGNAAYITVYLDDVSFIKATPPTPQQVQLEFSTGGIVEALIGSMGIYSASIPNASYWTNTPVSVALTANTSVSFEYKTRLYSHRFTDSNWRTNIGSIGVAYTIDHGLSADLTFYAYVGYLGQYENPDMNIVFPSDWENLTVSDPFLTDLTSTCIISSGFVTVPTSIIDRLGWWEVKLQSPNYAKSIKPQIFDATWSDATTFRIGNETRANVIIGTDTETMGPLTAVNVSWFNPSDQIWTTKQANGGILGQVYSESIIFNTSSPAGEWWVEGYWTNGTEVAYDRASFAVIHSANLIAEPSEITTDAGSIFKGIVRYTDGDTGAYLMDTSATLEGNWSASIVPFVAISVRNWWEADFDTSLLGAGKFTIIVTASKPYYDDASCMISVHSINVTHLISPNAPWTASKLGSQVDLTFRYESYHSLTDTWSHVKNESDVIVAINWTMGYWSVVENSASGFYLMTLDTNIVDSGTYLLNVTFSKPNHELKTIFLTLILSPMASSLVIYDGLSDTVDLEAPRTIKLGFMDKNSFPVQNANVTVDSVSPSSGLSHTSVDEVPGETGNYSTTLTAYSATVFTIRFLATGKNVEPAISVFVIVVNDVQTSVVIFGSSSVEIGFSETHNTTFRYEMLLNGTGIENAAIDIVYSGPTLTLSNQVVEDASGNYNVSFSARLPGTYIITIIAYKPFHQRASSSFALTIRNVPTNLTLSVGEIDEMGLTDTYEMTFRYQMSNGTGIDGAEIKVFHSPNITSSVIALGFGNYALQVNATKSGGYLITMDASKLYCQRTATSFLLNVRDINTTMVSLNGTGAFVGFGKNYTLFVSYTNSSGHGLDGANISIVNADPGITWSPTQDKGSGIYSILLTPLSSNSFSVTVQATLENHLTRVVFFTLTVTPIPTTLTTLDLSTSISVDQNFTVHLQFLDEDTNALLGASLSIINPSPQIEYTTFEELGGGIYQVTLTPTTIGTYDIVFSASKAGYQTDYAGFTLSATIIQTELVVDGGFSSDTIKFGETYQILVLYRRIDTGNNVTGAIINIDTQRSGLVWSSFEEVDGGYRITFDPQRATNWTIDIFAGRDDYELGYTQFQLRVDRALIAVGFVTDLSAVEGSTFSITVRLTESGTTNPIDDARVLYRFSVLRTGLFQEMNATGTPGEYTVSHSVPLYASSQYRLEIDVEKENYVLLEPIDISFTITQSPERLYPIIAGSSGIGILLVVVFVALRIYSGRKKKQLSFDMVSKRRFDDADNLIGVIVLHKKSGIPIYSRIPKGGFDEGIVAAFVSAITHFREEFEMFDDEQMQVIPISDIIRAVQTRNLICAFVTVRSASVEQNRKIEAYGMQVGTYMDDLFDEQPSSLIDERINEMLDYIFDITMDGHLLKFYKMDTDRAFPKRYRFLAELMESLETRHCSKPVYLAQGVATYGVSQARGCTLVLEAIDKGLLHICDKHEIKTSETEFKEYFRGSQDR